MEIRNIDERQVDPKGNLKPSVKKCPVYDVKMPRTMKVIGYGGPFKHLIERALAEVE